MAYDKLKERIGYKKIERMTTGLTEAYNKVQANRIAFLCMQALFAGGELPVEDQDEFFHMVTKMFLKLRRTIKNMAVIKD